MILSVAIRAFQQSNLKQELISLFSGAGMQLHKWSSNCIELLSNFDVSGGDVSLTIPDETKALGLLVLKPFVKNRVSVIQHSNRGELLKHVQSQEDPADIISRGIDPDKIQDSVLWWYGPSGLQGNPVVSTCDVKCKGKNQAMADLPSDRVNVSRVFTKVGIDYAGPFFIKLYP
ncbi:DUF5641 domain-containing protein, partial [Trichonephila clavipes]